MASKYVPVGSEVQVNGIGQVAHGKTGNQNLSQITALSNGNFVVVYQSRHESGIDDDIYAQMFSANGALLGNQFDIINAAGNQIAPSVAPTLTGGFGVAYKASSGNIDLRLFSSTGTPGTLFAVFGSGANPSIATFSNGNYVVAWDAVGTVSYAVVNPTATGYVRSPVSPPAAALSRSGVQVAAAGDRAVMIFLDDNSSANTDVHIRQINSSGITIDSDRVVADLGTDIHETRVAALADGRFVIGYTTQPAGHTTLSHFGKIYDPVTLTFSPEFTIVNTAAPEQDLALAGTPDGGFIATWQDFPPPDFNMDISARRFNANGVPVGDIFVLNTLRDNNQSDPSIAINTLGTVVTVWKDSASRTFDNDPTGIRGQAGTLPAVQPNSFNGGSKADILFQHDNGALGIWLLDGVDVAQFSGAIPHPGAGWHAKEAVDFSGNGKADILWQHDNGTPAVWLFDGIGPVMFGPALANPGPAWHVISAADFNGNGRADILFQHDNGALGVWLMDGVGVAQFSGAIPHPGAGWHAKDAADFNGDGKADVLWQHDNGTPAVWLFDGINPVAFGPALSNPGPAWHEVAAADFNADGKADILFQHDNGALGIWLMDGVNVALFGGAIPHPGAGWHVEGAVDTNGDGKADVLWQHDNGTPAVWLFDGTNPAVFGPALPNPGGEWDII